QYRGSDSGGPEAEESSSRHVCLFAHYSPLILGAPVVQPDAALFESFKFLLVTLRAMCGLSQKLALYWSPIEIHLGRPWRQGGGQDRFLESLPPWRGPPPSGRLCGSGDGPREPGGR